MMEFSFHSYTLESAVDSFFIVCVRLIYTGLTWCYTLSRFRIDDMSAKKCTVHVITILHDVHRCGEDLRALHIQSIDASRFNSKS